MKAPGLFYCPLKHELFQNEYYIYVVFKTPVGDSVLFVIDGRLRILTECLKMYSSKFSLHFLVQIKVEELIALAGQEHTGDKRQPKRPLIRLKVMFEIFS